MLFAVEIDFSKSFAPQQLVPLALFGVAMFAVFNFSKLKEWWDNRKSAVTTGPTKQEDLPDLLESATSVDLTEAEYRVKMFADIDEIRQYAIETGNKVALDTANKLINDLFATVSTEAKPASTEAK